MNKRFDGYTFISVFLILSVIWQQGEVALYGYSQESVMDTFCGAVLAFYITREITI